MISYRIPSSASRRVIRVNAYGTTVRLQFSWHDRPKAWFVVEIDTDGVPQGPERLCGHAVVVKTIRDTTGAMAGQLVMVDFNAADGDYEVASLGSRLQLYGFSRAEIDAAAPASLVPTVVSVTA